MNFKVSRIQAVVVAGAVTLAGCGSDLQAVRATGTTSESQRSTVELVPGVSLEATEKFSGPFDGSPESLGRCIRTSGAVVDILHPLDGFVAGEVWHKVVAIDGSVVGLDATARHSLNARGLRMQFETLDGTPSSPNLDKGAELQFFGQTLEAIQTELAAGNTVEINAHVATGGASVASIRPGGEVVMIGNCMNRVTAAIADAAKILSTGGEAVVTGVDVLQRLRETGGELVLADVSSILDPVPIPWGERDPMLRSLDPSEAPAAVIDNLIPVSVTVTLPQSWIGAAGGICTRQAAGWHSLCYGLTFADENGIVQMDLMVVADEAVELWLMDESGFYETARGPVARIEVSEVESARSYEIDLAAEFSTRFLALYEELSRSRG